MLYMLQVKSYFTEVNFLKSNLTCNNVHVAETKFVNSEKKNYFITDRMFDNYYRGQVHDCVLSYQLFQEEWKLPLLV